jgi:regulator of protease activity HflC (stomatin/prohibitin superfamily)
VSDQPEATRAGSHAEPVGPPPPPPPGPIAQAVAIGFRAVYVAGALVLLIWLMSNVHQIPSDSQAVVLRFGRIVRSQEAGLLLAWPRPIEQVRLLPGPDRQLSQEVGTLPAATEKSRALVGPFGNVPAMPQNASAYLTGDGNVVLLSAALIYRINDAVGYSLAQTHVAPALDRLFHSASVRVTAGRNLNDFLVVQSGGPGADARRGTIALRSELRDALLQSMNARLRELAQERPWASKSSAST